MSDLVLFRRDDSASTVSALEIASQMEEKALIAASLIGVVKNAEDNQRAVGAQTLLKEYLDTIESSRKFVKQRPWDLCIKIDELANRLKKTATDEMLRVSQAIGEFQEQEKARTRALEAARLRDLEEIERKRQLELSKAKSFEQEQAVQEKYNTQAAALPVATPARAEGQTIKDDWDVHVTDALLLATKHRQCVDIKPRLTEIKILLKAGISVSGIVATPVTKAGLRLKKTTIDV